MRRNLFWLSDVQWKRIEPHLPTDVRGVERADDRRVISGTRYDRLAESTWLQSALLPLSYGGFSEPGPLVRGLHNGDDANLDIGRSVTCGAGRHIFLYGSKEAVQKMRRSHRTDRKAFPRTM